MRSLRRYCRSSANLSHYLCPVKTFPQSFPPKQLNTQTAKRIHIDAFPTMGFTKHLWCHVWICTSGSTVMVACDASLSLAIPMSHTNTPSKIMGDLKRKRSSTTTHKRNYMFITHTCIHVDAFPTMGFTKHLRCHVWICTSGSNMNSRHGCLLCLLEFGDPHVTYKHSLQIMGDLKRKRSSTTTQKHNYMFTDKVYLPSL